MNMVKALKISVGQHSDKGRKEVNQDFHGVLVPQEPQLSAKGIVIALADGIGSSEVSQVASEFAVRAFLDDYYCTSDLRSIPVIRLLAWLGPTMESNSQLGY